MFFSESKSESESGKSESHFSSVLPYIYTLLNKLADDFFYQFS